MASNDGKPALSPLWKTVKPFLNGGASGMVATCCIQPIDIVKVRRPPARARAPPRAPALAMRRAPHALRRGGGGGGGARRGARAGGRGGAP